MRKEKMLMGLTFIALSAVLLSGCSFNKDTVVLKGEIANEVISSFSTVGGKIVSMKKNLGEPIQAGETVAVIDSKNQGYTVEQLQAVVDLKTAKLAEIRSGARPEQISQLEAQVRAAKAQYDLLKAGSRAEQKNQAAIGLKIAEEAYGNAQLSYDYISNQYATAQAAFAKGVITQADLDTAKFKMDGALRTLNTAELQRDNAKEQLALIKAGSTSQSISAAKANYDAIKAQLELAEAGPLETTIKVAEADLAQSQVQLDQAKSALENFEIKALASGIIISKNYSEGDVVMASGNIADIAVENALYVVAYLPDPYLSKVKYGDKFKVKTDIGEVTGELFFIALGNEYVPKDKQSVNETKHKVTKIKVRISDPSGALKSGMIGEIEIPVK